MRSDPQESDSVSRASRKLRGPIDGTGTMSMCGTSAQDMSLQITSCLCHLIMGELQERSILVQLE